jgi:cell division protein FtsI (penicillin-binding protein 3)
LLLSTIRLHQGGQVSAPIFQRITQQALEYLHVPHDVQLPPSRQVLLARRNVPDASLEESSPDHLGASLDMAEANEAPSLPASAKRGPIGTQIVSVAQTAPMTAAASSGAGSKATQSESSPEQKLPASGTVVLDVEEGGIEVPSFLGKNLRVALEAAQDVGLDLDAIGSGTAREQSPLPGAHVAAGSHVTVRFGR